MKITLSTVSALVILIVSWPLIAGILYLIGAIGMRAYRGIGLIHFLHQLFIWFLSPGVGGFYALYITGTLFRTVAINAIYISFVSVVATLSALLFLLTLSPLAKDISVWDIVTALLQTVSIFVGAWFGRILLEETRKDN